VVASWESGAWDDGSACEDLSDPGAEFVQLAYQLEMTQGQPDVNVTWQAVTREAAAAYLAGTPWPDWSGLSSHIP